MTIGGDTGPESLNRKNKYNQSLKDNRMNWLPRRTVVIPIDFSDDSFASLEAAREMSQDPSSLHVLHVLPILEAADPGIIWHTIDDESRRRHAKAALLEELKKRQWDDMNVEVLIGDPGHEIVNYAEELNAGLIVVASHGQGAIRRLLLGSVADRVVRLANCPVLVLKHKKT